MNTLKASVQYGDWEGTAAADDSDGVKVRVLLEKSGAIKAHEFVVAIELFVGESHKGRVAKPYIDALLFNKPTFDTVAAAIGSMPDPLPMRKVRVDISLDEFIGLYKRFSVTLSRRGLNLVGREYQA